jgi:hypothetical protein
LRCNAHGSYYACHNATLAFVKSLARDGGYHAPKGDFCVRESSPSADGVRADGVIALADEDPSKDRIIDVFGSDHSNISFVRASSNILFEKAFEAGTRKKSSRPGGHKQSTTTRRTHIAAPFPASGSTTLISGPSYAYLCLLPGVFLLNRTTLMMPNATTCKMLYNHLPPPYYHLVFTLLV